MDGSKPSAPAEFGAGGKLASLFDAPELGIGECETLTDELPVIVPPFADELL